MPLKEEEEEEEEEDRQADKPLTIKLIFQNCIAS